MARLTLGGRNAGKHANGVLVRWCTASEIETLGFHVYREVNGARPYVRVTRALLPASGWASEFTYSYLDRSAPRGKPLRYWIQVVNLDGSRSWYGPAGVAARRT